MAAGVLLLAGVGALARPPEPARPAATVLGLRVMMKAIESYSITANGYPAEAETILTLRRLLVPTHAGRLPAHDGWGQPWRIALRTSTYEVRSAGEDARFGTSDDLVAAQGAVEVPAPACDGAREALAREDLARLGRAAESYRVDNGAWPPLSPGALDALVPVLAPLHIRRVPLRDPWGRAYEGECSERGCTFRSAGADADGAGDDLASGMPEAGDPLRPEGLALIASGRRVELGDEVAAPDVDHVDEIDVATGRCDGWSIEGLAIGRGLLPEMTPFCTSCVASGPSRCAPESAVPRGVYVLRHVRHDRPRGAFGVDAAQELAKAAHRMVRRGFIGDAVILAAAARRLGAHDAAPEAIAAMPTRSHDMGDVRTIATAIESYAVDAGAYPRAAATVAVATLAPLLEPTYVRRLPTRDSFGQDMTYRSDGATYRVIAPGADGRTDEGPARGGVRGPDEDLVFEIGAFTQWWEGTDGREPRAEMLLARHALAPALERRELTRRLLKTIGAALESRAIDEGRYPEASSFGQLAPLLEPTYLPRLPVTDAWGVPFEGIVTGDRYRVRSRRAGMSVVTGGGIDEDEAR